MNRGFLFLFLLTGLAFSSCKKEKTVDSAEVKELQLTKISEVKGGVTTVTTFSYDEHKMLSTIKKGNDITVYTYSGSKIINIEVNEGTKTTSTAITYKDDLPSTGIVKIYQSGVLQTTLDVNISSGISDIGQINYYDKGTTSRRTYFDYDNGNIIGVQDLQNRSLTFHDFIYGERKNVLFNAHTRWALGFDHIDRVSTNEVLKIATQGRFVSHLKTFDYTYNEEGLPITAVVTETDPPLTIETKTFVTYTYERL
ncbi:hypothetical protein ACXZ1K_00895 [Pedobacter sp. PWIIR3]